MGTPAYMPLGLSNTKEQRSIRIPEEFYRTTAQLMRSLFQPDKVSPRRRFRRTQTLQHYTDACQAHVKGLTVL
jgi:hypothetical protein